MKNNSVILSGGRLSTFRHNGSGEISVEAIYGNRVTIAVDGSVTILTTRGTVIRVSADGKVSEHLK
jgi:hypothetical protein